MVLAPDKPEPSLSLREVVVERPSPQLPAQSVGVLGLGRGLPAWADWADV